MKHALRRGPAGDQLRPRAAAIAAGLAERKADPVRLRGVLPMILIRGEFIGAI